MPQPLKLPYLNEVIIAGRLVDDPHPLKGKEDREGSSFTVASNRYSTGRKAVTTFINCIVWGDSAKAANEQLKKGSAVLLAGSLANYEKKGESGTSKVLQVSVSRVQFLNAKPSDDTAE